MTRSMILVLFFKNSFFVSVSLRYAKYNGLPLTPVLQLAGRSPVLSVVKMDHPVPGSKCISSGWMRQMSVKARGSNVLMVFLLEIWLERCCSWMGVSLSYSRYILGPMSSPVLSDALVLLIVLLSWVMLGGGLMLEMLSDRFRMARYCDCGCIWYFGSCLRGYLVPQMANCGGGLFWGVGGWGEIVFGLVECG